MRRKERGELPNQSGTAPPIRVFAVEGDNTANQGEKAERAFARAGYPNVRVNAQRIIRLEGCEHPEFLMRLLVNPAAGESIEEVFPDQIQTGVEVAYRLSVMDPETLTALEAAEHLGVDLDWLRLGWRYETSGIGPSVAREIIESSLCNPVVQTIVTSATYTTSLRPTGIPDPVRYYDLLGLDEAALVRLSRDAGWYSPLSQLLAIQRKQHEIGRLWTDAEIEMICQSWGDHCFHTTWGGLGLFRRLKTATRRINHPLCRSIFSDNAGAMAFYDGWVIFIKGETHNHPSAIATFGGIQTKHGGLLRDLIFMMCGGYPLGCSTIMGTRLPSNDTTDVLAGALSGWTILTESIEGTHTYCNPMGVPMMYASYRAHRKFAKCLALGIGVGIAPEDTDKQDPAEGDVLILIGGSTGRDGVHGATASSANLTAEMVVKEAATVQIGSPIIERQFTTLVPVLRDKRWIKYLTDLGAGGLSCAVGETCAKCGADVSLDGLPLKDESLAPWEKWVSESQERGLVVVTPENVVSVLLYCRRYGVQAFVLGKCRSDRRLIVTDHGERIVDIDLDFIWKGCPIDKLSTRNPNVRRRPVMLRQPTNDSWRTILGQVVNDYACCDQSLAINQFDSTVQGRTVVGPLINGVPSDAFVCTPLRGKPYGAISAHAFNHRWSITDPVGSVSNLLALAISRTVAIGVSPEEIVLCGNWYTPTRTEEQRWYLSRMVGRLCQFTEAVKIPVVSGKDSSSGTFKTQDGECIDVPMTLVPSTLARMPDVSLVTNKVFKGVGHDLFLVRPHAQASMAGTIAYELKFGEKEARLPWVSDKQLLELWQRLHGVRSALKSVAAIGEGGLFLQAFHGCLASGLGATLVAPDIWSLLGECPGSFLITTEGERNLQRVQDTFAGMSCSWVGMTTSSPGMDIGDKRSNVLLARDDWPILLRLWQSRFEMEVAQ